MLLLPAALLLALVLLPALLAARRDVPQEAVTLNEAVDDDLVRINQARSAGGYSRFMIELENLTDQPLTIDPYGSAFDPPRGVHTQRVGIGHLVKIGDRTIPRPRSDPSEEAPVGPGAGREGDPEIPDDDLPAAAGAAAGVALVGTLLTGLAQGVRPKEALSDFVGVLQGEAEPSPVGDPRLDMLKTYREQDMTELDFQRQRLDAARQQGAADVVRDAEQAVDRLQRQVGDYDRNLAELGERPAEHAPTETRRFDFARHDLNEEVRADLASQAAGTLSDTDRIGIKLWIADNAPTGQSMDDLQKLADSMATTTGDGQVLGDRHSILEALGNELQRTNQPRLTYFEKYAVREGDPDPSLWDAAKKVKDGRDLADSMRELATGEGLREAEDAAAKAWEGSRDYGDLAGRGFDMADAGVTILADTQKYLDGGSSGTAAVTRAVTQYGVDFGVNKLMEQHPVMKVVNNVLKFSEPVVGKDITPARGWKVLVDKAFDSATGELDHRDTAALDFDSDQVRDLVRDSQAKAIEERLGSGGLSDAERADLSGRLRTLRGAR